jgi:GMP synthase-like glutamine amidotransferase
MSWHQDQVIEKPAAAEIAGSSAFCKYAALSYGDRALTIQPYPEFDAVYVADLARRTMLPGNLAVKTLTGLDKSLLSAAIAD